MVTSYVKSNGGVPTLFVNDKSVNPSAYITYFTDKNMYREFSDIGYTLYSVPTYFTEQTINEVSRIPPFQKGIFDEIYSGGKPRYELFDSLIADILKSCPNAYIFPRVNASIPYVWEEQNPDECYKFGYDEHRRVSFWSDKWLYETQRLLALFVEHIEESSYRDHIIGYQISAGNTEEWFPFDMRGCRGKCADEKFREYCLEHFGRENGTDAEFARAFSERTAYSIIELSRTVKECTASRLAVGAFYGYSFEVCEPDSGHAALRVVLDSKYVDFLCSPNSYYKKRIPGIEHPYMLPIDTLKKAGKLYFAENDTRTHLSTPPNDLPRYQNPLWRGPERDVTIEIMKMHFAKALCHGNGMWWFDMWGGWYRDEKYLELLEKTCKIYEENIGNNLESKCEIALFFDESGVPRMNKEDANYRLIYNIREPLGVMGVPYDMYLADDCEVMDNYKAIIVVQPVKTEISEKCIALAKEKGIDVMLITGENMEITSEELRSFCRKNGTHIYCNKKAVIYSNNSFVFIHTGEDAEFDFTFDGKHTFTDVYTGESITFPKYLPIGKSFLFKR